MSAEEPTILATSIGFHGVGRGPWDWRPGPIYRYAAELARAAARPRICFLNQATGDQPELLGAIYATFARTEFRVSHLALFPMPNVADIRAHLLAQDIIWVTGGSVANLMAVWRAHDLPDVLHECWQAGVVLGGCSAGSICWHVGGPTDSFGPDLRPFTAGLGWLPYANGVHYDAEEQRRPLLRSLVGDGTLPAGYASDNGVGLVFRGTRLAEAVTERDGALGYEISRGEDGTVAEWPLRTRLLADDYG